MRHVWTARVPLTALLAVSASCASLGRPSTSDARANAVRAVCGAGASDSTCIVRSMDRIDGGYRVVVERHPPLGSDRVAVDVRNGGMFGGRRIEVTPLDSAMRRP